MSLMAVGNSSTSSTTGFVLPRIVRSPVTLSFSSPAFSTFVDLKVIFGWFCGVEEVGRLEVRVALLLARVDGASRRSVPSTRDFVTSWSSSISVPSIFPNSPRTLLMPR